MNKQMIANNLSEIKKVTATLLEKEIGIKAIKLLRPLESGDVINTFSDNSSITNYTKYKPQIKIEEGIKKFIAWYKDYYKK